MTLQFLGHDTKAPADVGSVEPEVMRGQVESARHAFKWFLLQKKESLERGARLVIEWRGQNDITQAPLDPGIPWPIGLEDRRDLSSAIDEESIVRVERSYATLNGIRHDIGHWNARVEESGQRDVVIGAHALRANRRRR